MELLTEDAELAQSQLIRVKKFTNGTIDDCARRIANDLRDKFQIPCSHVVDDIVALKDNWHYVGFTFTETGITRTTDAILPRTCMIWGNDSDSILFTVIVSDKIESVPEESAMRGIPIESIQDDPKSIGKIEKQMKAQRRIMIDNPSFTTVLAHINPIDVLFLIKNLQKYAIDWVITTNPLGETRPTQNEINDGGAYHLNANREKLVYAGTEGMGSHWCAFLQPTQEGDELIILRQIFERPQRYIVIAKYHALDIRTRLKIASVLYQSLIR